MGIDGMDNLIDDAGIQRAVKRLIEAEAKIINDLCKEALAGGTCGVKVLRTETGLFVSAAIDLEVPYGEIHSYNSEPDRPFDEPPFFEQVRQVEGIVDEANRRE